MSSRRRSTLGAIPPVVQPPMLVSTSATWSSPSPGHHQLSQLVANPCTERGQSVPNHEPHGRRHRPGPGQTAWSPDAAYRVPLQPAHQRLPRECTTSLPLRLSVKRRAGVPSKKFIDQSTAFVAHGQTMGRTRAGSRRSLGRPAGQASPSELRSFRSATVACVETAAEQFHSSADRRPHQPRDRRYFPRAGPDKGRPARIDAAQPRGRRRGAAPRPCARGAALRVRCPTSG